ELSVSSFGTRHAVSNRLAGLASGRRSARSRIHDRFALGSHHTSPTRAFIASLLSRGTDQRRHQQLFVRRFVTGLPALSPAKPDVSDLILVTRPAARSMAQSSRLCSRSLSRSRL